MHNSCMLWNTNKRLSLAANVILSSSVFPNLATMGYFLSDLFVIYSNSNSLIPSEVIREVIYGKQNMISHKISLDRVYYLLLLFNTILL